MAFERFIRPAHRATTRACASIYPRGQIAVNSAARRRYGWDGFSHIVLYFDADIQRIGLEPTRDATAEGAMRLYINTSGTWCNARAFLDAIGALPLTTHRFPLVYDDASQLYVICLKPDKEEEVP